LNGKGNQFNFELSNSLKTEANWYLQ